MKLIREYQPTDQEILKALDIRTSQAFGAMRAAHAFAGRQTVEWALIDNFTLVDLLSEAEKRGILPAKPVEVELHSGDEVTIYYDPYSKKHPEAKVTLINKTFSCGGEQHWWVRFEDGTREQRVIWTTEAVDEN